MYFYFEIIYNWNNSLKKLTYNMSIVLVPSFTLSEIWTTADVYQNN